MYLHFVVPKNRQWKAFCGPSARTDAIEFAGNEHPIWSMTQNRAAILGLLSPKTDHDLLQVSLESTALYSIPGSHGERRAF